MADPNDCQRCTATAKRCNRIEVYSFATLAGAFVLYFLICLLAPHIGVTEEQTASLFTIGRYLAAILMGVGIGAGMAGA